MMVRTQWMSLWFDMSLSSYFVQSTTLKFWSQCRSSSIPEYEVQSHDRNHWWLVSTSNFTRRARHKMKMFQRRAPWKFSGHLDFPSSWFKWKCVRQKFALKYRQTVCRSGTFRTLSSVTCWGRVSKSQMTCVIWRCCSSEKCCWIVTFTVPDVLVGKCSISKCYELTLTTMTKTKLVCFADCFWTKTWIT